MMSQVGIGAGDAQGIFSQRTAQSLPARSISYPTFTDNAFRSHKHKLVPLQDALTRSDRLAFVLPNDLSNVSFQMSMSAAT